ncbi:MAG TPA: prolyl oligopeptidase family serine peptidase [Spongiibacteraceae bacterium]
MKIFSFRPVFYFFILTLIGCAPTGEVHWLKTSNGRLKSVVYKSDHLSAHPLIVIVLHGDLPQPSPKYQYEFAQMIAGKIDDVVAVGILRPAYTDPYSDHSDGEEFLATGDNYTPEVVDAIGAAAEQLRSLYAARAVILIGHSGGATIAANLLGRKPKSADAAVLVACGCDPVSWRERMQRESDFPGWKRPVRSLFPLDLVAQVNPSVRVDMLVGANDDVAPPEYTHKYHAALRSLGIDAREFVLPNLGHNILFAPSVVQHVSNFVATYAQQGAVGSTRETRAP